MNVSVSFDAIFISSSAALLWRFLFPCSTVIWLLHHISSLYSPDSQSVDCTILSICFSLCLFFFFAYFLFISAPDIFCWASWAGLRSSACRSFQLPFFFRQSHLSSNKEVFQIALRQSDQSLCTNKPWLYIRLGHSVIPGVSVSQHKIIKYAKTPPYIKTTGHRTCREYFFHSQDQRCKTKDKTVTSVTIFPGGGFKSCRC